MGTEAAYQRTDPSRWPPGVRVLSIDEMDNLGIDDNGQLFWDGRPVVVRRGFDLTFWQKVGAAVGITSGATAASVSLIEFILEQLVG